jgi:VAD1 Analog of StAR-related lipid transfer domain
MRVEFEGIPYADTFAVEIRWVATREGERDVKVEVGVEVDFKKNTFLKSKIRAGTIEETAPVHKNLFEAVQAACAATSGVRLEELEVESGGKLEFKEIVSAKAKGATLLDNLTFDRYIVAACGILALLALWWRSFSHGVGSGIDGGAAAAATTSVISADDIAALSAQMERMEAEIKVVRQTLAEILSLVKSKIE